jgi:ubiquinone/menaquinone biosynthesis C-methylase UbiE
LNHFRGSLTVWSGDSWWAFAIALGIVVLLIIWEVWICEGAHLGSRFVVWLYDLTARRYDRIKSYDPDWERRFLGEPVAAAISALRDAQILDVGAGTGRLLRYMPRLASPEVNIVCLEPSRNMVQVGREAVTNWRARWVRGQAPRLPFDSAEFDLIVCVEVLEFTPDPRATLKESVRVLRPGGWLLVTNRIGWQAPFILGHTFRKSEFPQILERCGLEDVRVYPWQVDYDLAWARKSHPA